jgi:hypothetical protein
MPSDTALSREELTDLVRLYFVLQKAKKDGRLSWAGLVETAFTNPEKLTDIGVTPGMMMAVFKMASIFVTLLGKTDILSMLSSAQEERK